MAFHYRLTVSMSGNIDGIMLSLFKNFSSVFEIVAEGKSVRFAAGEFSNGVWGFYPEDQHAE
jgi:hypothetical protein